MNDEIQKIWDQKKRKCYCCARCLGGRIFLNRSFGRFFFRYWVECLGCHWRGPRGNTISGAIWRWNRAVMQTKKKIYE